MASGDLITTDYQFEIRTTLFGAGINNTHIEPEGIKGLGNPEPKSSDVDLWGQDGVTGNPEYPGVRVITIPALILSASAGAALGAYNILRVAWVSSTSDLDLVIQLPGWDKILFTGRPRGCEPDMQWLRTGEIGALLRFDALDPTINFI